MQVPPASSTTQTITQTEPKKEVIVHVLHRQPKTSLLSLVQELGTILKQFGKEHDFLSKQIRIRGCQILAFAYENRSGPFDSLLSGLIERVNNLAMTLKNPRGRTIFKDPWLVNKLVWEKSRLDDYQRKRLLASLPAVAATPHLFANEVIHWLDRLHLQKEAPPRALQDIIRQPPKVLSKELDEYEAEISELEELQESIRLLEEQRAINRFLEFRLVWDGQERDRNLARVEEQGVQQTAELRRGIEALQTQQQQTVALHLETTREMRNELHDLRTDLNLAERRISEQDVQILTLCHSLQACASENNQLRNEIGSGGSCSLM